MMSAITDTMKPRSPAFRTLVAEHPLIAFFTFVFILTWLMDLPMVLGKDGLGILPYSVPLPLYVILFILGAFGPTITAFLVTAIGEGRQGTRRLFRRYGQWRFGIQWYLFALFAFPAVYLAAASIWLGADPLRAVLSKWPLYFTTYLPALLIFPALITWGEEPGWRGFALTRMQPRYGPLLATLVVGFMHGVWHLPIFLLVNGPVATGPFNLTRFLVNVAGIIVVSIIWTWVFNNARTSILMAVLLHASFNAAQAYIGGVVKPYPVEAAYTALGILLAIALIALVATKGRLSYQPELEDNQRHKR
jgi:membrane protease YdiL (CAAX protease family)